MNKFSLYVRLLYFVVFVFITVLFLFSPRVIVVHFINGIPDGYDNRILLYVSLLFLYLSVKLVSFFQNIIEKKRIHKSSRYFSQVKLDFFRFIYW